MSALTGSRAYAEARAESFGDPEKAARRIINETTAMVGTASFVTGLGGLIALPVTLPANITGQAVLNARMVGAIAHLRGWDLRDEIVRNAILITVAGGSPNAVLSGFGVKVSQKLAETAIKKIPIDVLRAINKKVGFMLVAKYGTKRSMITLTKLVPGVGGVVGGTVDAAFTRVVARVAKRPSLHSALTTPRRPSFNEWPDPLGSKFKRYSEGVEVALWIWNQGAVGRELRKRGHGRLRSARSAHPGLPAVHVRGGQRPGRRHR